LARFVRALEAADEGAKFRIDRYTRPNGDGGGITTVLQDSKVFEYGSFVIILNIWEISRSSESGSG